MNKKFLFTAFLIVTGCSADLQPAADGAQAFAIANVTVVPMTSAHYQALEDHTVIVSDGTITELGPSGEIRIPSDVAVIDGSGLFLLPGLFDTHAHLRNSEGDHHLALYLANGVTTVQSMHGTPEILEMHDRLASGELFGPRVITTGPPTSIVQVDSPERAEAVVRQQGSAGYDAIKMYGDGNLTMSAATYRAVIDAAHEHGMRVVGHSLRNHPFELMLQGGQDSIDHMEEIVYTDPGILAINGPLIDSRSGRLDDDAAERQTTGTFEELRPRLEPVIDALAASIKAADLAVAPTLVAFRAIWLQTTPQYHQLMQSPEMRYMSPQIRMSWGPAMNRYRTRGWRDILDVIDANLRRSVAIQMLMVKRFYDAGVRLMVGTDSPMAFVYPGFAVHEELALFVESGLTPYQALRAATAVPAAELAVNDSGTIAPGQRADLLLLSGNPITDIRNTRQIAGVAANGVWLSRAVLDQRLVELTATYAPQAELMSKLEDAFATNDSAAIVTAYLALGEDGNSVADFVEAAVNTLGYQHLESGDLDGAATAFRLNTEAFPESANTWDSLAEAFMSRGQYDTAIEYYQKSLELDPDNTNAERMIEQMRSEQ